MGFACKAVPSPFPVGMDYKSSDEALSTNPTGEVSGDGIPKEKRDRVVELLKQGLPNAVVAEQSGVSKPVVIAIKKKEMANGFAINEWKKQVSTAFASIVSKGADRLSDEIERIPAGQLPVALAILTDKILALQDAPQTIVEHRLRVSHEDINRMIKGEVIDIPVDKPKSLNTSKDSG